MKTFRRLLAVLALFGFFLAPALPAAAQTDPFADACSKNGAGTSAACTNPSRGGANPLTGPNGTLTKVTKLIGYIAGICTVIIVVVAGFMYVTSGGDPGKISNAKDAIIYALIGVVITIIAQAIIYFVLARIN